MKAYLGNMKYLLCAFFFIASGTGAWAEVSLRFQMPGAGEALRDDLLAASLLRQVEGEDAQELLAAAHADYARLLGALYANGHFGAVIRISMDGREAAAIDALAAPNAFRDILVRVDPGPLYRFGVAEVAPLARGTELPEGFRRGSPAATGVIGEAAVTAIEAWRAEGHAKARVEDQNIVADHVQTRVDARLRMAPGPKLKFGTVSVSGNKAVRSARVLKIAGLDEGRDFDPAEIARAERRLRRSGSFASVVVEEGEVAPGNTLPLEISVAEQVPRRFGFGAEVSTIEGVRLSGFWLHRNFLGGAERFRVDGSVSGIGGETGGTDLSFGARYERPATPSADVDLFAELSFEHLDEPDFRSDTGSFELGFTRYATDNLVVEFGLGALYSDVRDDFGEEQYALLTLPLAAEYDRRNDPLNPTDGYFLDVEATPFYALSGGDSGARIEMDARGYQHLNSDRTLTFAARLQLGSLLGPDLLESPPFYRFYSGGGGTVRGQDYQSLAIDLGAGNRSGGRSLLALSTELRADVTERIQAVGFFDWGYVGVESFPDLSGGSHSGAGIGVRYNTGIGPIRFDIATPVSGDTDASSLYFYVGIGQAF